MYMAYATRPMLANIPGTDWWKVTGWTQLGLAADMAEAKKLYGGSPVLEVVRK